MHSDLILGNKAFKEKDYGLALRHYQVALAKFPKLAKMIQVNISMTERKIALRDLLDVDFKKNRTRLIQDKVIKKEASKIDHTPFRINVESTEGHIKGWCVNTQHINNVFSIDVYLDNVFFIRIKNDEKRNDLKSKGLSSGFGGFNFASPSSFLPGDDHSVSFKFPNGSFSKDYHLTKCISDTVRYAYIDALNLQNITIIVPIFNAPDDLKECLNRLLRFTPYWAKILLINDCSTNPEIDSILVKYKKIKNIKILNNEKNIGFTKTINRGIHEAGNDDVILLNSDARVNQRWLESMLAAANSAPRIATVTAMSDRAGAFSAPEMGNNNVLPQEVSEIAYARSFRRQSLGLYPRVPTGNGFCMYVNRKCIDSIGSFDVVAFPRGYGEENDFCMRALRAGWSNIIDDRTYVFHERSKSFGEAKTELIKSGRAIVDSRYPEYKKAIQVFTTSEKISLARNRASLALNYCKIKSSKHLSLRVLYVVSTRTGGTPQTNQDLMQALSDSIEGWLLRCDSKILELSRMLEDGTMSNVCTHKLDNPVDPLTHSSEEYDQVVYSWLQNYDIDLLHIRHLGWHGLSLPRLARRLGIKSIFSFHDYYAISPTVKLVDDTGIFLGQTFQEASSIYRESLWPKEALPTPEGKWLLHWQERFNSTFKDCDAFITTSISARQLILDVMPTLPEERFVVVPHGRDFSTFHRMRHKLKKGEPIRILVLGHINAVKGLEVIRQLIEYDKSERLEFHVLGDVIGEVPKRGMVIWGPYKRNDFAERVRAIKATIGIIFSIWDETYCHTLTELWAVGLPAAVLNFPNVSERVSSTGAGWILDHHNIPNLYQSLLNITMNEGEFLKTEQSIAEWQAGAGRANSISQMAIDYLNIYSDIILEGFIRKRILSPQSRSRIGVVCPASEDLRQAPGSTHIRLWERTRNSIERAVSYIKISPANLIASAREKRLDGVIIQRTAIPMELVENVISALSDSDIKYFLDLDDDLLNVPNSIDSEKKYYSYVPALRQLMESATAITVSTSSLKNNIEQIHQQAVLVPNYLSDRLWSAEPLARVKDGFIRALYMGSLTHDEDLELILPALDAVAKLYPRFKLSLVGVSKREDLGNNRPWLEVMEVPDKNYIKFTKWIYDQSSRFDFAIAPLCDTKFNSYKSDLKILDYGLLCLPIIASNLNVYRSTGAPSVTLVGNTKQEWVNAIQAQILLGDVNLELGSKLREWVLRERMLETTIDEYDRMVQKLLLDQLSNQ
jgi:GT2 family glycosyltransferase/glycosyltransferase involved in cell wall biosynthesis